MTKLEGLIGTDTLAKLEIFDYALLPVEIVNNLNIQETRLELYNLFHEWGYFAECVDLMSRYPEDQEIFTKYWIIAKELCQMFLRDRLILSGNKQNIICGRYTYSIAGSPEFCFLPTNSGFQDQLIRNSYGTTIGKFTGIAPGVKIFCGGNHQLDSLSTYPFWHTIFERCGWEFTISESLSSHPFREWGLTKGIVSIGNDVWIGQDVCILSGTVIPDGCVIGAGSVVSGSLEPFGLYVGNPAKLIRYRQSPTVIRKLQDLAWWDMPLSEIKKIAPCLCSLNTSSLHHS